MGSLGGSRPLGPSGGAPRAPPEGGRASGAYAFHGNRAVFHRARRPVGDELNRLLDSLSHRIALGPQAGRKTLTLYSVPPLDVTPNNPLLAQVAGFSLHAASVCEAHQRDRLKRLCRYITRPPVATKRLSVDGQGRVVYRYKQPFRDGSTHVVLEPLDFIARLAALVPRPRLHLTRFHGEFAPIFRHRDRIVPRRTRGRTDRDQPVASMTWARRLKRVFAIDIETCPQCGERLRVIACERM